MFENNLIFSLVLSIVVVGSFYLFSSKELSFKKNEQKNEFLLLFALIFSLSFIMKCISSKSDSVPTINNPQISSSLSHSSRPPF